MKKKYLIFSGLALFSLSSVNAQQLKDGYIDWGKASEQFYTVMQNWNKGDQLTADDNFFISRVKPKERFRNAATQVRTNLTAENDKKLCFWVPINSTPNNALPNGVYDSEVFPMWNYITYYGNWTAPFVRLPGNFADVAHKNGVAAGVVAGVPYGSLGTTAAWYQGLDGILNLGADKMADLCQYYGVDGLGYNSEFSSGTGIVDRINTFHTALVKKMLPVNPIFENMWYDGTNDNGGISFDQGLASHNDGIFGDGDNVRTSLFFNYNWNNTSRMESSIAYAKTMGRNPLDLYCGFNMQGAEPKSGTRWPLLVDRTLSIGLWGAHSQDMFFESRGEQGSLPEVQQNTYLKRVEKWFTGGTRNPANCPAVSSSMSYASTNDDFMGMSTFMTARSSLKWDLSTEPFISYFNLGNGKFFNWGGERQVDREWYNIGIQDYLPTWRFWFANKFLGRDAADVPASGLDADFTWDDAWMGGSLLRIHGTTADEYLHLFKTEFALSPGDVITVRYKVMSGSADINLALSSKGNESTVVAESNLAVMEKSTVAIGEWVEKTFTVRGPLSALTSSELAMVALHFTNAQNLNLFLGEFSIVRGTAVTPASPVIASTAILAANHKGVDGKIIFNMPNDKAPDVCYNLDVNTSMFKLYAQQEGKDAILVGATTSWAGMYFAVPFDFTVANAKIRFGVSAVALDMKSESEIAWSAYTSTGAYAVDDNIAINKTTIKPNEDFEVAYVDQLHENGKWEILDEQGNVITSVDNSKSLSLLEGLPNIGNYTLRLTGMTANAAGKRVETVRTFGSYIQVTSDAVGALPKILTLTANDQNADINVKAGDVVAMKYTGRKANGTGSQGVALEEKAFGFQASAMSMEAYKPFTLAFWVKINEYVGAGESKLTQLLSIRDKGEGWPKTDWGWCWNFLDLDGTMGVTFRGTDASSNQELSYRFNNTKIEAGPWTHMAYVFDFNSSNEINFKLYVNGKLQTPSAWTVAGAAQTRDALTTYIGNRYPMRAANLVAIGGPSHSSGGIIGSVDNFQYYDTALSAEEVASSMGNITTIPSNLKGFWSMETTADSEGRFANEGTGDATAYAGRHVYEAASGEGMGTIKWEPVAYAPGSPFVTGSAYTITTTPSWSIYKGDISNVAGTDLDGAANVKFAQAGVYTAKLTLTNGWGTDSKTFQFITVGTSGVEGVSLDAELKAYPNPFVDHVNVQFANEGVYTIRIFDMGGALVSEKTQEVAAGDMMQVGVNAPSSQYIAQILKDGKLVRAVKLLKK